MKIRDRIKELRRVRAGDLLPNPKNWRRHPVEQHNALRAVLADVGYASALVARETPDGLMLIDGHLRAETTPEELVPVLVLDVDEREADRLIATMDPLAELAIPDEEALAALLRGVGELPNALEEMFRYLDLAAALDGGADGGGAGGATDEEARATLAERFGVPPFSVLDARQGYWQERKRAWIALGIKSEMGRGENLLQFSETVLQPKREKRSLTIHSPSASDPSFYKKKAEWERENGRKISTSDFEATFYRPQKNNEGLWRGGVQGKDPSFYAQKRKWEEAHSREISTEEFREKHWVPENYRGTSIFDPVLCELVYRWFCPEGGRALDPFAGGSVRGIVAGVLGREYVGIDLRPEQIAANDKQTDAIKPRARPRWIEGDSRALASLDLGGPFDLVFSCPPYFDLERYSDDPRDLSNTEGYEAFIAAYREIVRAAAARLGDNRFACFVVGDIRGEGGFYRNFVSDTIAAFADAGMRLYNEAILVTSCGSLPIRVGQQFGKYRKLGKAHQNVLVFFRGDPARIPDLLGACEFGELETGADAAEEAGLKTEPTEFGERLVSPEGAE